MTDEMKTEKPEQMDEQNMKILSSISLAPYIQLSTELIKKGRKAGGNMYRHQMDTLAILIDYSYIDPVLLKASVIHDCIEDIPNYDKNLIKNIDTDGEAVLNLVMQVTKRNGEAKDEFLKRIIHTGSHKAKILKCADRISNMTALGFVTEPKFIHKVCEETEAFILPMAIEVDFNMYSELISLLESRMRYLESTGFYDKK